MVRAIYQYGNDTAIAHSLYGENTYNYSWTYDDADRVQTFTSPDSATAAGYNYDDGNQLKTADYDYQADESYNYDANGNRTSTGGVYQYQTGPQNRITQDTQGYAYTYDHEGNRKTKILANQAKVEYDWDNRDRLTEVRNYTWSGTAWVLQKTVDYTYDGFNRRVGKSTTASGATTYEKYAYDGQNMVLQFGWPSSSGGGSGNALQHVMLYGPAVDQILADDGNPAMGSGGGSGVSANVRWMLADNEGSIRDVAKRDGTANSVRVDHLVYDAFGNITSQTAPAEQPRFTYTAREFDADTGLYYYRARWYDAKTGKFISEDPMSLQAGDENLYRYVKNGPTNAVDPTGMWRLDPTPAGQWIRYHYSHQGWTEKFKGCVVAEPGDSSFADLNYLMTGKTIANSGSYPSDWKGRPKVGQSYSIGSFLEAFNNELRSNIAKAAPKFTGEYLTAGDPHLPSISLSYRQYINYFFTYHNPAPRVECQTGQIIVETKGLLDTLHARDEYLLIPLNSIPPTSLWISYAASHYNEPIRRGDAGAYHNYDPLVTGDLVNDNVVIVDPGAKLFALNSKKTIWTPIDLVIYLQRQTRGKGPVGWNEKTHEFWDVIKIEQTLFAGRNKITFGKT